MRRAGGAALATLLGVALALALLEAALRLAPSLVPRDLLLEFEPGLRSRVARRLGLPVREARACIPPEARSDGGRELCPFRPHARAYVPVDAVDLALGAVEALPQDARGFCNPPAKGTRERAALVTLGDSFTWCTAVSPADTWTARLEERLGVATYALALPGIGPHDALELLRREGLSLAPSVVLLAFYEGNDLRDALAHERARWAHARRRAAPAATGAAAAAEEDGLDDRVRRHSLALNLLVAAGKVWGRGLRRPDVDFRYEVRAGGRPIAMNPGNTDRSEVRSARALRAGEVSLDVWESALAELARLARAHGFTAVVAYLPSAHSAYAASARFRDPAVGRDVAFLGEAQRAWLAAASARHGLPFWDLTASLRAAVPEGPPAYFPGNLHLTRRGHALVAELLAPRLRALGLGADGARSAAPAAASGAGRRASGPRPSR